MCLWLAEASSLLKAALWSAYISVTPMMLCVLAVSVGVCTQVKQLLSDAKDPDVLITHLPSLLEPRTLISVLVTVRKW